MIKQLGNKSILFSEKNNFSYEILGAKANSIRLCDEYGMNIPYTLLCSTNILHSQEMQQELLSICKGFFTRSHLIVRSSHYAEDTLLSSNAGQFLSVVVTEFESIEGAIAKIYRQACDLLMTTEDFFVIIQEYISFSMSGVAFSLDPLYEQWAVRVNQGYGENFAHVDGTTLMQTNFYPRSKVLSDSTIAMLAMQCEKFFGFPQDIEWGISIRDSKLYILQSRPITTFDQLSYPMIQSIDTYLETTNECSLVQNDTTIMFTGCITDANFAFIENVFSQSLAIYYKSIGVSFLYTHYLKSFFGKVLIDPLGEAKSLFKSTQLDSKNKVGFRFCGFKILWEDVKNMYFLYKGIVKDLDNPEQLLLDFSSLFYELEKEYNNGVLSNEDFLECVYTKYYPLVRKVSHVYSLQQKAKKKSIINYQSTYKEIQSIIYDRITKLDLISNSFNFSDTRSFEMIKCDLTTHRCEQLKNDMRIIVALIMTILHKKGYIKKDDFILQKDIAIHKVISNKILPAKQDRMYRVCSTGVANALLMTREDLSLIGNEKVIVYVTNLTPDLTVLFPNLVGIIAEYGSELCHLAIMAREYHIPVLTGVPWHVISMYHKQKIYLDTEKDIKLFINETCFV